MVLRHASAVLIGLLVAEGIGLLAGAFADDRFWLHVAVFAVCTSAPAYGLGWLLFVAGATGPAPPAHPPEGVEHDWWQRSAATSLLDLLTVAGVAAFALVVTGLEVSAAVVLGGVILLGSADLAVRFAVLRRRAA